MLLSTEPAVYEEERDKVISEDGGRQKVNKGIGLDLLQRENVR